MLRNLKDPKAATDTMLAILQTSGTLAGIAVGLVGVINARPIGNVATLGDDVLALAALGFLVVCFLVFFAVRHIDAPYAETLVRAIDVAFLASLTLVVFSGFVLVYAFV